MMYMLHLYRINHRAMSSKLHGSVAPMAWPQQVALLVMLLLGLVPLVLLPPLRVVRLTPHHRHPSFHLWAY